MAGKKRKPTQKQLDALKKGREKQAKKRKSSSTKKTKRNPSLKSMGGVRVTGYLRDWKKARSDKKKREITAEAKKKLTAAEYDRFQAEKRKARRGQKIRKQEKTSESRRHYKSMTRNPRRKSFGRSNKNHYLIAWAGRKKMFFAGDRFTPTKSKAVVFSNKNQVREMAEELKDRLPRKVDSLAYEYS